MFNNNQVYKNNNKNSPLSNKKKEIKVGVCVCVCVCDKTRTACMYVNRGKSHSLLKCFSVGKPIIINKRAGEALLSG